MSKSILFVVLVALLAFTALPSLVAATPTLEVTSFSYDPVPASPGTTINLWIQVKNNSNEPSNNTFVRLGLDDPETGRPNYPFSAPEQDLEKKFSLNPYQTNLIKYVLNIDSQALNGNYQISISLGNANSNTVLKKSNQTISILARNPKVEIIDAPKVEQKPGSQFEIPITLKNLGNATAYNVLVGVLEDRTVTATGTVIERPINSVGNSLQYIEKLTPGETKVIQLHLSVDNTALVKTYSVPVTIKWQDTNKSDYSTERTVGVRIIKEPSIDVGLGEIKVNATNKNLQDISLDIFNKGASTAKNVTVEVKTNDATLLSTSKVFIGTLESDDFDSFKSTLQIPTKGKDIQLALSITYTNSNDDELKVEKQITVPHELVEPTSTDNGPSLPVIIVALIVLGLVGNWGYNRFFKKGKRE